MTRVSSPGLPLQPPSRGVDRSANDTARAGVQGPMAARSARAGIAGLAPRLPARAKAPAARPARRPASQAQAAQAETSSHESHGAPEASQAGQRLAQVAAALGAAGGMETYLASQQAMQEQQMAMSLIEAQQALAKRASDMVKNAVS